MRRPAALRPRWYGIGTRVMILSATGMLTSLAVLGWVSLRSIRHLEADVLAMRAAAVEGVAAHLDDRLTVVFSALQGLATRARGLALDQAGLAPASDLRDAYLRAAYVEAVFVLRIDGTVSGADPGVWPDQAGLDLAPVVREAATSGTPWVSNLVAARGTDRAAWRLVLLVPIRDWQGTLAGFAGAALDPQGRRFDQMTNAAFRPGLGEIDLMDGAGRVIASSVAGRQYRPADPRERAPIAERGLRLATWRVAVRDEPDHVGAGSLVRTLAWLGPILFGLSLLFAWGAGRSVSRPLHVLTDAAERIAGGDLREAIPALGYDEVGRLGQAFERMRVALSRSLDDIASANAALEQRVEERTRELARVNAELRDRERVRQQLLRKVISAQEDERKRLARELHDETTQTVTALGMHLELALSAPPERRARELEEARALAGRSLDELRRLMHDLRPAVLDDLGLVPALRWYAQRHLESRGVAVRFEVGALPSRLPYELETAIFRACQEALTNVARHADAEMVLVEIECHGDRLDIDIEDDGRGFDPETVQPSPGDMRGLGLLGMRERVELFGGSVRIDAAPGRGTHVAIRVPVTGGCEGRS